jgi:hypothetical protein
MTRHRSTTLRLLFAAGVVWLLFALSGCSEDSDSIFFDPSSRLEEILFQDGIFPDSEYSGTRDAFLKEGNPFNNHNFGITPLDTIGHLYLTDSYFERRFIIRFDLTEITDCGEVLSAELQLHFSSPSSDTLTLEAYEVTVPEILGTSWLEGTGGIFGGVSWLYPDGTTQWDTEGGNPVGPPVETVAASVDTLISFILPNSLVLGWIEDPETNHGVVIRLAETVSEEFLILHTRESLVLDERPLLAIEYLRGG